MTKWKILRERIYVLKIEEGNEAIGEGNQAGEVSESIATDSGAGLDPFSLNTDNSTAMLFHTQSGKTFPVGIICWLRKFVSKEQIYFVLLFDLCLNVCRPSRPV